MFWIIKSKALIALIFDSRFLWHFRTFNWIIKLCPCKILESQCHLTRYNFILHAQSVWGWVKVTILWVRAFVLDCFISSNGSLHYSTIAFCSHHILLNVAHSASIASWSSWKGDSTICCPFSRCLIFLQMFFLLLSGFFFPCPPGCQDQGMSLIFLAWQNVTETLF